MQSYKIFIYLFILVLILNSLYPLNIKKTNVFLWFLIEHNVWWAILIWIIIFLLGKRYIDTIEKSK